MSSQHLGELGISNITSNYYWEDKSSPSVKVIDIHKIREFSTGQGVTVPLNEFERDNAIFVDEGHKGDSKEDSQWRNVRDTLSHDGFAFEYSATFGQLGDEALQDEYAKCIIFDYSYGHFWEDGYGKDYWIHNLTDDNLIAGVREHRYLLQNLLLFVQQKLFYYRNQDSLQLYNIQNPLLVFVGSSVEPKATGIQAEENKEVISDVKKVLDFVSDFLNDRAKYVKWIDDLKEYTKGALFKEDYFTKLEYLFRELKSAAAIYNECLKLVFHTSAPGDLELCTIRNANGEIAVKVKNADSYFALIYIGDTSTFKSPIAEEYEFKRDVTSPSQFQSLSDTQENPINILIGARRFIEGWNNYRVSSIGLINFGRSKGSQIIQLFGRGGPLKGKNNSLKRSKGSADSLDSIQVIETLNIFGLRADYMKRFKDDLEREGIKTVKKLYTFDIKVTSNLNQLKLFTLERDETAPSFDTTPVIKLAFEQSIKVRLDIAPKKFQALAGDARIYDEVATEILKLSDRDLGLVDWDEIYLRLLNYKKYHRYAILHISRLELRNLFSQLDYQIISDAQIDVSSLTDIEKVQKLVYEGTAILHRSVLQTKAEGYEGRNLAAKLLTKDNANIATVKWLIEVTTTDDQGIELAGINTILQELDRLADMSSNYPDKFSENQYLLNCWLDAHLYQPLLKDEDNQTLTAQGKRLIESIVPPGMNRGEFEFIEDLKNFIAGQKPRYPDCDFFLLRNMSRGKGFGFYFVSGGFYPDFLLWIQQKKTGKQYLTFIDPHGLRNEANQWDSDKIGLHVSIKEKENEIKLKVPNLILNSFILQPPPGFISTGIDGWHREDDPKREIPLIIC